MEITILAKKGDGIFDAVKMEQEMLCIQDFQPALNIQSDSLRAKDHVISVALFYGRSLKAGLDSGLRTLDSGP